MIVETFQIMFAVIPLEIKVVILGGFIIGIHCFYKDYQAKKNKHDNQL